MLIVCPLCSATYDVPQAMLGPSARKVRCAKCLHEWVPEEAAGAVRPEGAPVAAPVAAIPPAPAAARVQAPPMVAAPMPAPDQEVDAAPGAPVVEKSGAGALAEVPPAPRIDPPHSDLPRVEPPRIDPEIAVLRRPKPGMRTAPDQTLVALAASVVILLLLAGAASVWRAQVMQVWPPSERVFAALGLH